MGKFTYARTFSWCSHPTASRQQAKDAENSHILALKLLALGFHFFGFGDCFVDVAD